MKLARHKSAIWDQAVPLLVASFVMLSFAIFGTNLTVGNENLMMGAALMNGIFLFIAAWMGVGVWRLIITITSICWWIWLFLEVMVNPQHITTFTIAVIFAQPVYLAWSWLGSRYPDA